MPKKSHKKLLRKGNKSGKKSQRGGLDLTDDQINTKYINIKDKVARLPDWNPYIEPSDKVNERGGTGTYAKEAIIHLHEQLEKIHKSEDKPKANDYLVIYKTNDDKDYDTNFLKIINAYLKKGWVLQGGVSIINRHMCQALKGKGTA